MLFNIEILHSEHLLLMQWESNSSQFPTLVRHTRTGMVQDVFVTMVFAPMGKKNVCPLAAPTSCNLNLAITVSASSPSFNTNLPPNFTIDNKPETRWISTSLTNPFITYDLGSEKPVCRVDIAWYDGDGHQYQFNILTATNPNEFKDQFSGFSAGNTASPEKYHFNQIDARWVRISITNPSSTPRQEQIAEVDVFGPG